MAREPGPAKKSWRDIDRARSSSYHATETLARHEQKGHQTSVTREYKAALEALFQKKPEAAERIEKMIPTVTLPRVVEAKADDPEARVAQKRQDLLRKISSAQNPKAISDTIDTFLGAGFVMPEDQDLLPDRSANSAR